TRRLVAKSLLRKWRCADIWVLESNRTAKTHKDGILFNRLKAVRKRIPTSFRACYNVGYADGRASYCDVARARGRIAPSGSAFPFVVRLGRARRDRNAQ